MGKNNITTRCSERLVTRNLTLRLGYDPPEKVIAANCHSADNSRKLAFAPEPPKAVQPFISDIDLERENSSDLLTTMAEDERVAAIEGKVTGIVTDVTGLKDDVTSLKTEVEGMSHKMDKMIQAMNNLDVSRLGATGNASAQGQPQHDVPDSPNRDATPAPTRNTQASQANIALTNQSSHHNQINSQRYTNHTMSSHQPARNGRHISQEEFIQTEMDRDAFHYPESGKHLTSYSVGPAREMIKPYMYLYRDGVSTPRQKLDARQSITATEYMDAALALLADTRAYHPDDFQDIFHHLRKVARDILERPWYSVRRWSQYIFDSVEAGSITWADRDIIQDERVRICLTGVQGQNHNNSSSTYQIPARRQHGTQEIMCRAFNTRNGCP